MLLYVCRFKDERSCFWYSLVMCNIILHESFLIAYALLNHSGDKSLKWDQKRSGLGILDLKYDMLIWFYYFSRKMS